MSLLAEVQLYRESKQVKATGEPVRGRMTFLWDGAKPHIREPQDYLLYPRRNGYDIRFEHAGGMILRPWDAAARSGMTVDGEIGDGELISETQAALLRRLDRLGVNVDKKGLHLELGEMEVDPKIVGEPWFWPHRVRAELARVRDTRDPENPWCREYVLELRNGRGIKTPVTVDAAQIGRGQIREARPGRLARMFIGRDDEYFYLKTQT